MVLTTFNYNISRYSLRDSIRFYNIAHASLEETKYHLILSKDLGYISSNEYEEVLKLADECGKTLHGWIKSQKNNLE